MIHQWQVERVPCTVEALLSGRPLESRQSVRRWNLLLMGKVSQVVYADFERRFVKAGEELFTYEIDL